MKAAQRVIFLDRDGVINKKAAPHEYITKWSDFEFLPGVVNFLKSLKNSGYRLIVVTNQQGVGKGIFSERELNEIHRKMCNELGKAGIHLDAVLYCPHLASDNCVCRKPKPGLLYMADSQCAIQVNKTDSYLIGDSESDVQAAQAYGIKAFYLNDQPPEITMPDLCVKSYADILRHLGITDKSEMNA